MQIPTEEVRNGNHDGKLVWVCHYNRPDLDKKPLRNLPPTKVLIRPNSETTKNVYYSKSFFSALRKDGKPLATVISPVDNTGFRSNCGNELFVFDDEKQCIAVWNSQVREVAERIHERSQTAKHYWRNQYNSLMRNIV